MTGSEFRRLRSLIGASQQSIADALSVQRVTVSRWELGKHQIPMSAALVMAAWARGQGGDQEATG